LKTPCTESWVRERYGAAGVSGMSHILVHRSMRSVCAGGTRLNPVTHRDPRRAPGHHRAFNPIRLTVKTPTVVFGSPIAWLASRARDYVLPRPLPRRAEEEWRGGIIDGSVLIQPDLCGSGKNDEWVGKNS
jgi:hypothetical protein